MVTANQLAVLDKWLIKRLLALIANETLLVEAIAVERVSIDVFSTGRKQAEQTAFSFGEVGAGDHIGGTLFNAGFCANVGARIADRPLIGCVRIGASGSISGDR